MIAPPNPLRGLTGGDGEYLKGVIGEIDGPVLLVGHSYGGAVITAAGTADNVVGLVYIDPGVHRRAHGRADHRGRGRLRRRDDLSPQGSRERRHDGRSRVRSAARLTHRRAWTSSSFR
jgi:pimeloyl-ACP methyl ester carboxylesterase